MEEMDQFLAEFLVSYNTTDINSTIASQKINHVFLIYKPNDNCTLCYSFSRRYVTAEIARETIP